MPLPSSGRISADLIRTEFGRSGQRTAIGDFVRGGGIVPALPANANISLTKSNLYNVAGYLTSWSVANDSISFGNPLVGALHQISLQTLSWDGTKYICIMRYVVYGRDLGSYRYDQNHTYHGTRPDGIPTGAYYPWNANWTSTSPTAAISNLKFYSS